MFLVFCVCFEFLDDCSCLLRILISFRVRILGKIVKWLLSDKVVGYVLFFLIMNFGVFVVYNFFYLDVFCKCNIDKCVFNVRLILIILIFCRILYF